MATDGTLSQCVNCGFSDSPGSDRWDAIEDPTLGRLTRCPDCGSTNVLSGR